MASEPDYHGFDIPFRLWRLGREIQEIRDDDWIYWRHPPLEPGTSYGSRIPSVDGKDHLENQSVHSAYLLSPGGPRHALFNTKNGCHHLDFQIARLNVGDLHNKTFPNRVVITRTKERIDAYTFRLVHDPHARMYSHCIIEARKKMPDDARPAPPKDVPKVLRTAINQYFAQLADENRPEMDAYYNPGVPAPISVPELIIKAILCAVALFYEKATGRRLPLKEVERFTS